MTKLCIVGLFFFCCIVCSSVVSASGFTVSSEFGARVYVDPDVVYTPDYGFSSRLYIKPSTVPSFNITTRVFGGDVTVDPVFPVINVTSDYDAGTGDLTVSWVHGNNTDTVVLVMNNDSIPADAGDGDVLYNNTGTSHSMSVPSHPFYLEVFAYNETCNEYSVGVSVPWGIFVNVYDENNAHVGLTFDLEVTNQDGSMVYVSAGCSNPEYVNESLCPHGDYVKVSVSAAGYYASSQTFSILEGEIKVINMYLPPEEGTGPGGPGVPCEIRTYIDSKLVTDPDVDCVIPLSYTVEDVISVEVFNSSLFGAYGGWLFVTQDNYTLYDDNVTVDSGVLDSNSTMVRVSYYYEDCSGTASYLYQFTVLEADQTEYGASAAIPNAFVTIKRYINTSNSFVTVRNGYTDGNGQVDFYLVSYVNYKIYIEKDGYVSVEGVDFTANPDNRFKTYRLERDETYPVHPPSYIDYIDFSAERTNITLTYSYNDRNSNTTSVTVVVYRYNDDGSQTVVNTSIYSVDMFSDSISISSDFAYRVVFNVTGHNVFDTPIVHSIILPSDSLELTTADKLNTMFINIFGDNPFGWVNFIAIIVLLAGLFAFGQHGAGLSLMGTGFMFLFINVFITGFSPTTVIPVLFIVLGVMVIWMNSRRKYK